MSKHRHGLHSKAKEKATDAVRYFTVIFLVVPGVLGFLGLVSRVPLGFLGGLLTIYYLVAIFVTVMGGLSWIARALE